MTEFKELNLLYTQFGTLNSEIQSAIQEEDYHSAGVLAKRKGQLLKKIGLAKKTAKLTPEQSEFINNIENETKIQDDKTLEALKKMKNELGLDIAKTKNKLKLSSAYAPDVNLEASRFIDVSE